VRIFIWFLAGALALAVIVCGAGLIFLKTRANGFSARAQPFAFETIVAQTARTMALPSNASERKNPVTNSNEALAEAKHIGRITALSVMRTTVAAKSRWGRGCIRTQRMTDGELFYIIENGIRLTGMPAWGGSEAGEQDSWKLVHFIRHLPAMSASEITEMGSYPKSAISVQGVVVAGRSSDKWPR
jgi:hypothetical protein